MKFKRLRIRRHRWRISSVNLAGHQSYRERVCRRDSCDAIEQQHLTWGGKPTGPWREATPVPCTHGRGGVRLMACMQCAVDRGNRGLR